MSAFPDAKVTPPTVVDALYKALAVPATTATTIIIPKNPNKIFLIYFSPPD
jgi:hypothetical protein